MIAGTVVAALLAMAAQNPAAPSSPPLWGELAPGPFVVGFTSSIALDTARPFQMKFDDGSLYPSGPRPILVNLWYPASDRARDGEPMRHGDYFELGPEDAPLDRFTNALAVYERAVVVQELFGAKESALAESARAQLAELFDAPTACIRDADPRHDRFPLIVYHAGYGSSYDDNAVLCEYLASQGYVVVGSAFQRGGAQDGNGGNGGNDGFNVDAHEGSARDVDFLIALLSTRDDVDAARVAMVGHSGGAHAALRQRARELSLQRAIVSLDTTQDYYGNVDPRWGDLTTPLLDHPERMSVPLLFCAEPHACFELADTLKEADRWYFTARLEHEEWIAQGVLKAELAARRAPAGATAAAYAKRVRADYTTLVRFVRDFLDAQLKGREIAQGKLASALRDSQLGAAPHVEFAAKGTTGPVLASGPAALPTPREMRPRIAKEGAAAMAKLLRELQPTAGAAGAATIYHPIFAFALIFELSEQGKDDDARLLGGVYREFVPDWLAVFTAIGDYGARIGRLDFARKCFETMLVVDPENADAKRRLATPRKN